MIVSIGIDIIEVARVREVLERTPRFTERVFTEPNAPTATVAEWWPHNIMPRASPLKKRR